MEAVLVWACVLEKRCLSFETFLELVLHEAGNKQFPLSARNTLYVVENDKVFANAAKGGKPKKG